MIETFTGFLFPSGLRLYGKNYEVKIHGEFFPKCRNFGRIRLGLLSALIPIKPSKRLSDYHLILTNRLFHDDEGRLSIGYHQYCKGVPYMVTNKLLIKVKTVACEIFF